MQKPNEEKRRRIIETAARLFAERPYHLVRLEDVAAAAKVGKGTVYVYFASKDDLYASLTAEGFVAMVRELSEEQAREEDGRSAVQTIEAVVRRLVAFSTANPDFFEMVRSNTMPAQVPELRRRRKELVDLIERAIRRGVRTGELLSDPMPALTANFIPSLVRSAAIYGPRGGDGNAIAAHILRVLRRGIDARPVARPAGRPRRRIARGVSR